MTGVAAILQRDPRVLNLPLQVPSLDVPRTRPDRARRRTRVCVGDGHERASLSCRVGSQVLFYGCSPNSYSLSVTCATLRPTQDLALSGTIFAVTSALIGVMQSMYAKFLLRNNIVIDSINVRPLCVARLICSSRELTAVSVTSSTFTARSCRSRSTRHSLCSTRLRTQSSSHRPTRRTSSLTSPCCSAASCTLSAASARRSCSGRCRSSRSPS